MPKRDARQGHLFGEPEPAGEAGAVRPAPPRPEHEATARGLPAGVRLGTSSWSFPGWRGLVYANAATPSTLARAGLAAYAAHPLLGAVGVDRTYYAPVAAEELARYAEAVPASFRFVVKAWSDLTTPWLRGPDGRPVGDNPRWLDADTATRDVVEPYVEGLGSLGGALVFQFPPQGRRITAEPARFADRLGVFLEALPRGPLYAVEIRDETLLGPDYLAALHAGDAVHCLSLHPRMPRARDQWERVRGATPRPLVVRWMLRPGLDYEAARERYAPFSRPVDPDPDTREALAEICLATVGAGRDALVIANNKAEGCAPASVFALAARISAAAGAVDGGSEAR